MSLTVDDMREAEERLIDEVASRIMHVAQGGRAEPGELTKLMEDLRTLRALIAAKRI